MTNLWKNNPKKMKNLKRATLDEHYSKIFSPEVDAKKIELVHKFLAQCGQDKLAESMFDLYEEAHFQAALEHNAVSSSGFKDQALALDDQVRGKTDDCRGLLNQAPPALMDVAQATDLAKLEGSAMTRLESDGVHTALTVLDAAGVKRVTQR
jgi:hypothetical protein